MSWSNANRQSSGDHLQEHVQLVQSASRLQNRYAEFIFWIFILFYVLFIMYRPSFGIIDDIRMLTGYVSGKPVPLFITPYNGRFAFLEGQEYIPAAIISPTAYSFYIVNSIQLLLTGWILVALGKMGLSGRTSILPYTLSAAVMITPGFVEVWLRFFASERNELLLFCLSLFFFLKLQKAQKKWYVAPCLIAAGVALCYKETAFVLVGSIGLFHLLLNRQSTYRSRLLDACLVSLSITYLAVYYFVVYRFRGPRLYSNAAGSSIHRLLHTVASNALHDPWIITCLLILLITRLTQIIRKHDVQPVLDTLLLSSFVFYMAYLMLRMGNIYYLLPIYAFVPYVGARVASDPSLRKLFQPPLLVLLGIMFLTQMLSGIREDLIWKFAPANFQSVLKFISLDIASSSKKVNLYLSGSNRSTEIEVYTALAAYLTYNRYRPDQFDIKSGTPMEDQGIDASTFDGAKSCPFSYCNPAESEQPGHGDYVLLTPYDSIYRRSMYSDRSHYELVFQTNTPIVPDPSLKTLADHLFPHALKNAGTPMIDTNYYLYKAL